MVNWKESVSVTTSGADGSAVGTAYSRNTIMGSILAVHVNYNASCPATTDLVLSHAGTPTESILALTDGTATGWYYPRRQLHDSTGTALTLDGTRPNVDRYVVYDGVVVAVAGCNALTDAVTVTLFWSEP